MKHYQRLFIEIAMEQIYRSWFGIVFEAGRSGLTKFGQTLKLPTADLPLSVLWQSKVIFK